MAGHGYPLRDKYWRADREWARIRRRTGGDLPPSLSARALIATAFEDGEVVSSIAQRFGVTNSAVVYWSEYFGIPKRNRGRPRHKQLGDPE
jgi:hypothetical protein